MTPGYPARGRIEAPRRRWIAPKLTRFGAGEAQIRDIGTNPDGPLIS